MHRAIYFQLSPLLGFLSLRLLSYKVVQSFGIKSVCTHTCMETHFTCWVLSNIHFYLERRAFRSQKLRFPSTSPRTRVSPFHAIQAMLPILPWKRIETFTVRIETVMHTWHWTLLMCHNQIIRIWYVILPDVIDICYLMWCKDPIGNSLFIITESEQDTIIFVFCVLFLLYIFPVLLTFFLIFKHFP